MDEKIIISSADSELNNAVQVIKDAILQSQTRALKAINQEQLALYYGVGRYISSNTRSKNWGTGFIDAISEQLRKELPGLRGFSAPSMRKMRTFYEEWKLLEQPNSSAPSGELQSKSFVETNKLEPTEQNSFVGTNKLPEVQFAIDANFPIKSSLNMSFRITTVLWVSPLTKLPLTWMTNSKNSFRLWMHWRNCCNQL